MDINCFLSQCLIYQLTITEIIEPVTIPIVDLLSSKESLKTVKHPFIKFV